MIELGIDMWTPQVGINEPDFLVEHYGDRMTFAFDMPIAPDATESRIRQQTPGFRGPLRRQGPGHVLDHGHPRAVRHRGRRAVYLFQRVL